MSNGLLADLYELTMAASYLKHGMTEPATFSLFVRRVPRHRGFLIANGLQDTLDILQDFCLEEADLEWLALHGFGPASIDALRGLRFTGDVWAIPEGRVVFPDEPLLEITAPLPEAQLVETIALNQITYQTALATKAARCSVAADSRAALVDFSMRRTHGIEASFAAAKAGAMAGFTGTSNVAAARRFGIEPVGTMAHSYVEAFPTERDAFMQFARDFPDRTTFLVDTYDTLRGVSVAMDVVEEMGLGGRVGVRLDSGDLLDLSLRTRRHLDDAGRKDIVIVASGGLDEFDVAQLLDAGAPIDVMAVGTKVGTSADAPALDSAYKLVEYAGRPVMKLSTGKMTLPGAKQVYRGERSDRDLLSLRTEAAPFGASALLEPVMRDGRRISEREPIGEARRRVQTDLAGLPPEALALDAQPPPPIGVSPELSELTQRVRRDREGPGLAS